MSAGAFLRPPPPSYQEATTRPDWLIFVAPYTTIADYRCLCLVSRRFWNVFAPLLWRDILNTVRRCRLDPSDDLVWWFAFVFTTLPTVRQETRTLVRVLDARQFAKDASNWGWDRREWQLDNSFKVALKLLPNVHSILLDGHTETDPAFLLDVESNIRLLSLNESPYSLPRTFLSNAAFRYLAFADFSHLFGYVGLLRPPHSRLRVLKLRERELSDEGLTFLADQHRLSLWSLDVSNNSITDRSVHDFCRRMFPQNWEYFDSSRSETEGKRVAIQAYPYSAEKAASFAIQESACSATFNHPDRYFADAPKYTAQPADEVSHVSRLDGTGPIREDTVEAAVEALSERGNADNGYGDYARGLTHLSVSGNKISSFGLARIVCSHNGQLEYLACDDMPWLPANISKESRQWPKGVSLRGMLGFAHLFRPLYCPNLRKLRIHHSVVTNIPTFRQDGLSTLAGIYSAENELLSRIHEAYPQTFVPDMNPRVVSLTLTCVPRRSSGPLITRLIKFLELLSRQERAIQDAALDIAPAGRKPSMLKGMRQLRLEFEPDPGDEEYLVGTEVDAEELLSSGDRVFSFFEDERTPVAAGQESQIKDNVHSSPIVTNESPRSIGWEKDDEGNRILKKPEDDKFEYTLWIPPEDAPNGHLQEYRRLVSSAGEVLNIGAASPAQILAGAPPYDECTEESPSRGLFVSHMTWALAVLPNSKQLRSPPRKELDAMRDVLQELKAYRLERRRQYAGIKKVLLGEPHLHWTGNLEVSTATSSHGRYFR